MCLFRALGAARVAEGSCALQGNSADRQMCAPRNSPFLRLVLIVFSEGRPFARQVQELKQLLPSPRILITYGENWHKDLSVIISFFKCELTQIKSKIPNELCTAQQP